MAASLLIAKSATTDLFLLPALANRHGLITGATGTGKTVTLQKMAESFAQIGVPVFLADIKGDLSGLGAPGELTEGLQKRLDAMGVTDWEPRACTLISWDVFAEQGHPIRATISDMGPLLLARLLGLNEIQSGVLNLIFKIADDHQLLLLDLKDLQEMVKYVGENAKQFQTQYGNIAAASIGAIQRGLLTLQQQGAEHFFGEPMLDIRDLMRQDPEGKGVINILAANKLYHQPKLYSVLLLWMLAELFENLPEVGDAEKPKLVFFFDEAHVLFSDIPPVLLQKIEQVVRLIRSKGVGIYFVSQSPSDIPESVLGQLGNRVQHALRAFTPRDQKVVKAAAQTMRANPEFDTEEAIMALGVGEALISFLDEKGSPGMVERAKVIAPYSKMGILEADKLNQLINYSPLYGKYDEGIDRESAYEILSQGGFNFMPEQAAADVENNKDAEEGSGGVLGALNQILFGTTGPRGGKKDGIVQTAAKSMARQVGNEVGRQILRGVLGSILGGRKR